MKFALSNVRHLCLTYCFYTENMEGTTSEMLETVLSNKVLDRGTLAGSEDVLSPTCTQPSLQNEQSKSVVTFAASVEACIGAKQENAKLTTNSPMHDTKSGYSSSVGPFLFSRSCLFILVCTVLLFQSIYLFSLMEPFILSTLIMVVVMLYHPF